MMMYLTALNLSRKLNIPSSQIRNVHIPLFEIESSDFSMENLNGIYDREKNNSSLCGLFPINGYTRLIKSSRPDFINLEGFYQNINNFPLSSEINYASIFPENSRNTDHGGDDDIVINIRGGEVLNAIHPHYTLIPSEFYAHIIEKTGKNPIFYGQLDDTPYLTELKEKFPHATFIASRGIKEDFDYIRKSSFIIPAISTFSWMAAWLSNAKKIFFPIAGIFSPQQHPSSMLLPLNDNRYEFYIFPIYFCQPVNKYKDYIDPVRNNWQFISKNKLSRLFENKPSTLGDEIDFFVPEEYIEMYPDLKGAYNEFGKKYLINHFCDYGFYEGRKPLHLDEVFYSTIYPNAALEVALGNYKSLLEYYIKTGFSSGHYRNRKQIICSDL
ncbi:O-fucosyltransferase family protein [Gluconobacter albidus]|uniref:hypothetical protein n=1 Tax=Gluconobacter albidus TaxID=318683 RepID=UPI0030B2BAB8